MTDLEDPEHDAIRTSLRTVGPALAVAGLLFTIVGIGSFFASFGSFEPPRNFWCAFVGLPLMAVGIAISKFAYLGAVVRYMADEVAPVGKDVTNYMLDGTKDSMRGAAMVTVGDSRTSALSSARSYCSTRRRRRRWAARYSTALKA